jgi:hypothetical protein
MSHAIPRAAFKQSLQSGNGQMIAIPNGEDNIHLTSDTGDALLLCEGCERTFNRNFDGPLINALKKLDSEISQNGIDRQIDFSADELSHSVVSIAWRICVSPASLYCKVSLDQPHLLELEKLLRMQSPEILRHCTVRLARLPDPTPDDSRGNGGRSAGQFIKAPEAFLIRTKTHGNPIRFAMDWTMFGFLTHLIVPRIPYPRSQTFGGLKRGAIRVGAKHLDMLEYVPLRDIVFEAISKNEAGKLSPSLKKRVARVPGKLRSPEIQGRNTN